VTAEQAKWQAEEVARWQAAEVCEVDTTDEPGICHPLLVADKPGWKELPTEQERWEKKFRLCLAVRKWVNKSLPKFHFKMETLAVALRSVWPGDALAKGDLKSGYNHVLLREDCRRFWRFQLNGVTYRMRVLFFGLATAPFVFSLCVMQVVRLLRDNGARMSSYIDDWMLAEPPDRLTERLRRWVWPVSGVVGFHWGSKCEWKATWEKVHLGVVVDAKLREVRLRTDRAREMREMARYMMKRGAVTVRTLMRLVGKLRAFQGAIPNGQLLAWELSKQAGQVVADAIPNPARLSGKQLKGRWRGVLKRTIMLDAGARRALIWIRENVTPELGKQWHDEEVVRLTADGGPTRAGARVKGASMSAVYPKWVRERLRDRQSLREVMALWLGAETFLQQLAGKRIVLENDCKGALAALRSMRNGRLAPWVAKLLWFLMDHGIELHQAHWVPGRELVRRGVDGLSRWVDVNDWTLRKRVWEELRDWNPAMTVDRFASSENAKLRRWNSRFHEPGTEAVDALRQDWKGEVNYACPPLALLSQVIELVRVQEADVTLVVPVWPAQPWWPILRILAPRRWQWRYLGRSKEIFAAGGSGVGAVFRHEWEFMAVRLFPRMWPHGPGSYRSSTDRQ
jgi:hypothetical protein